MYSGVWCRYSGGVVVLREEEGERRGERTGLSQVNVYVVRQLRNELRTAVRVLLHE